MLPRPRAIDVPIVRAAVARATDRGEPTGIPSGPAERSLEEVTRDTSLARALQPCEPSTP